jgi:peptidyl-prolyl cis-trans isomerase SurA
MVDRNGIARAIGLAACALAALTMATAAACAQDGATATGGESPRQLVDAIAAVVGDEIILESEVDEQFYLYQMRTGTTGMLDAEAATVRSGIVREMVEEMLLVAMAHRDTVELQPGELEEEMENRVADLVERHGSEEALDAALAEEGLTLADLKDIYNDEIERRLLAERIVRSEVHSGVNVTWGEVQEYYEEHTDEVGDIPEAFLVAGIMVTPKVTESAREAAYDRMTAVSERLTAGEPFEDAVFALAPGEVSGIIQTRFGFHIAEVLDITDAGVTARHILARVAPGPDDEVRARATADSLRQRVLDGEEFGKLARMRSDDPASREEGGVLGWFTRENLAPAFHDVITGLEVGEVAEVAPGESGFYVLKLVDHNEARTATLDEVRENLRDYIFAQRVEVAYGELIDRLSSEIFVDIRTALVPEEPATEE